MRKLSLWLICVLTPMVYANTAIETAQIGKKGDIAYNKDHSIIIRPGFNLEF